jgi:probable phosphoglycerate mutase
MKELILIRHGESEHHVNGYTGGWTDLPLTDEGMAQARKTGPYLKYLLQGRPFTLISSDLLRAKSTAEAISASLKVPFSIAPELRELNNGKAKGLKQSEAKLLKLPRTQPSLDWVPFPEAESWRMMFLRVAKYLDALEATAPADPVVLVTHGNAMICMVNWWLRLTDERSLEDLMYTMDPCSISQFDVDKDGCRRVVRLNDTAHLLPPLEGIGT